MHSLSPIDISYGNHQKNEWLRKNGLATAFTAHSALRDKLKFEIKDKLK
jgi:hypothetical protein